MTARFTHAPGAPAGYSGFTDHHAMRSDLNALLLPLSTRAQCELVGFGLGLARALVARCDGQPRTLSLAGADAATTQLIGVLQHLQDTGTDNASPSTRNLRDALQDAFATLRDHGPVRTGYWDQAAHAAPADEAPLDRAGRAGVLQDAEARGAAVAARMA